MPDPVWQKSLEQIVGLQSVSTESDAGWQALPEGSRPSAIASPDSPEQTCELMSLAAAERLKVVAFGHGTKLRLGGDCKPVDLAISLNRLNKVCDYPARDLTISVEAGLPVRGLESALAAKGQMLPLDIPFAELATVGGAIAANANGPRRLAYGTWRDMVLGVKYVTAEGKLARGGGKVVKNVAGYDIPKLMIGSLGTLGILVEITLKVFPCPPASATMALHFGSPARASQASLRIVHSQLLPQALDLIDSSVGELMNVPELQRSPFTLLAGVPGPERVLARYEQELPALVRAEGLDSFEIIRQEREAELWKSVQEVTPVFLGIHADGIVVKASLPVTASGNFIARAQLACRQQGLAQATRAHAGSGIVYFYVWPATANYDASSSRQLGEVAERLVREAEQLGGRAIVEWCPSELRSKINLWGALGDDFASMRQLKAALDPNNLLSPGRFYGGI